MFNYNSAGGEITRIAHVGGRVGNIGLNSTNDFGEVPYYAEGTDRFWTGGITFSTRQNGSLYEFGYESFTGDYNSKYETHIKNGKKCYRQTTNDLSLNRASTFIRTRGVAFDFMKSGWLQDFIHDRKDDSHHFDYFSDIDDYIDFTRDTQEFYNFYKDFEMQQQEREQEQYEAYMSPRYF